MRSIIAAASLIVLILALGCNFVPHRSPAPLGPKTVAENVTPTAANLVNYLNENAKLLGRDQAVRCTNMTIDLNHDNGRNRVSIGAMMMCQMPRNFRLTGKLMSNPIADIGSNDQEFWYWFGKDQPPYLKHCSYEAMARGARVPFPFPPDMVVDALGLASHDPNKPYEVKVLDDKRGGRKIVLSQQAVSPQNQPIQKMVVFDYRQAAPPQPQVIAHVVKDARGNVLGEVNILRVQRIGERGPIVPKVVVFKSPADRLELTMRLENPQVVAMTPQRAADVFTRRSLSYQSMDLATGTLDGSGVQQAGAMSRGYGR